MYIDHPTQTDERERPERSLKDLAAVLITTPSMEEKKLIAQAEIFPRWQDVVSHPAVVPHIGTSIRGYGESEHGKAEGREGPIFKHLTEGLSVDFVTHAGRGGEVGALMEAARDVSWPMTDIKEARNAADWLAAYIHSRFTMVADDLFGDGHMSREERIALSGAIGEALDAFNAAVADNVPQLMTRDPYGDPTVIVQSESKRSETSGKESAMSDADTARIEELETKLSEAEQKTQEAETKAASEKERGDRAEDKLLVDKARSTVREAVKGVEGLPKRAVDRVVEQVVNGDLPTDSEGKLIESELKDKGTKAAEAERDYLLGEDGGSQGVRGMGTRESQPSGGGNGDQPSTAEEAKLKEAEERLEKSMSSTGMSESAAKVAAKGR